MQRYGAVRLQRRHKLSGVLARLGVGLPVPRVGVAGRVVNIGEDGLHAGGEVPNLRPRGGVHRAQLPHPPVVEAVLLQIGDGHLAGAHLDASLHQLGGVEIRRNIILVLVNRAAPYVVPVQRGGTADVGGAVGGRHQNHLTRRGETPRFAPRRGVDAGGFAYPPVVGRAETQRYGDVYLAGTHCPLPRDQLRRVEVGTEVVLVLVSVAPVDVVPIQGGIEGAGERAAVGGRHQSDFAGRGETPRCAPRRGIDAGVFAHPPIVGRAETHRSGDIYLAGSHGHQAADQFRRVEVGTEVILVFVVVAIVDEVPIQGGMEVAVEGGAVGGRGQCDGSRGGEAPHGGPAGGVAVQTDAHAPVVGGAVAQLVEPHLGSACCNSAALQLR